MRVRLIITARLGTILSLCASAHAQSNDLLAGSTIIEMPDGFQPELIYKKHPTDEPVTPAAVWQLSFGVSLETAAGSVMVTLQLDPQTPQPDIVILRDTADFTPDAGLFHNYDPAERFELEYTGPLDPFVGPVDVFLQPDGFDAIPIRVHLSVADQPGFPVAFLSRLDATGVLGDVDGDGRLEIFIPGQIGGVDGVYAFDHAGDPVPGWPFVVEGPDIINQLFSTPVAVDLDGDGRDELLVVVNTIRNVTARRSSAGTQSEQTLFAVEGSGQIRWQFTDALEAITIPAVADLDDDTNLDVIVGTATNLKRLEADGTPADGWQAETLNDIHVAVPIIADVDNDPTNGMEIVACTPVFGPDPSSQVYVWNEDGSLHDSMWPNELESCRPPIVVDLDSNPANGREIILALDHDAPPVDPGTGFINTFSVFAWHADGTAVNGWPHHVFRDPNSGLIDDRVVAPGSAGDVDGDGDIELVIGTYGQGSPANGNLFLFHHDGRLDANWPQWAGVAQTPSVWGGPALGDLDGDGRLEIVTGSIRGAYVFRADGQPFEGFPRLTSDVFTQPMMADLDGDGHIEIVEASLNDGLYVWRVAAPSPPSHPWRNFRQNAGHTGSLERVAGSSIPTLSEIGFAAMFALLVCAGVLILKKWPISSSSSRRPASPIDD